MLKLRLSRGGAKKRPYYSIVVANDYAPRDGKFIEKLGTFNPMLPKDHEHRLRLLTDRIQYWLSQGAQPTERVARFLGEAKIIAMPAQGSNPQKAQPKAKMQERAKVRAEKIEAKKAAEEEAAKAAQAPAEEPQASAEDATPAETTSNAEVETKSAE